MHMETPVLKKKILWHIYLAWFFKRILPIIILEIGVVVMAVYFLAKFVFIERVVGNSLTWAAHNPISLFAFFISAFVHTTLLKQIIIIIGLALGALLIRDIGRIIVSYQSTSRAAKPSRPPQS